MELALKISQEYGKGYLSYSSIKLALQDMKLFEMKMRDQLKFETPPFRSASSTIACC